MLTAPMKNYGIIYLFTCLILLGCSSARKTTTSRPLSSSVTGPSPDIRSTVVLKKEMPEVTINTMKLNPQSLVDFAMKQIGVPYLYGSSDRNKGFDCSGFISYVFGHFNIMVPRISYQFTNAGVNIPIEFSKPGDIILFTGSNPNSGIVGHMGIVTENDHGFVKFIHASSSKGVMISTMNSYFVPRFVKVNRIFVP